MFNGIGNHFWQLKRRSKLICSWFVRLSGGPSLFVFRGESYRYFWHRYKVTWRNERAVEVPIARGFLADIPPDKVPKVGNVLFYYDPVSHEIVDKYERAECARNEDVCDFKRDKKHGLILSIATLEHRGWDEEPKDESEVLWAFDYP